MTTRIFTIGFTKKSAKQFFELLRGAGVRSIVDVRLNNVSQLAGFSKQDDLDYFARIILDAGYRHETSLAPTKDLLKGYQSKALSWPEYEASYRKLLVERRVESRLVPQDFADACLLCSEPGPEQCHRRIAAEYLQLHWSDLKVSHLR